MSKKTKVLITIGIILLAIFGCLMFIMSYETENVPNILATALSGKSANAIKMGYTWNSFSGTIIADSVSLSEIEYKNDNTLLALPNEKITLKNLGNLPHKFYCEDMKYYDKSNAETIVYQNDGVAYKELNYLEITAPEMEGTYIYSFALNYYKKGVVNYALKVVVSSDPSYNVKELSNYAHTYIGDSANVGKILNLLPYSKNLSSYVLRTVNEPYELMVNYQDVSTAKSNLENSSVALFVLIDNLGSITYKLEDEIYVFSRDEIETAIGRDLSAYSENPELWEKEILFKDKSEDETNDSNLVIYKSIVNDILSEINSNNSMAVALDISSFEQYGLINLNNLEERELLSFCMQFSNTVYECVHEDFNKNAIVIYCANLVEEDETYTITVEAISKPQVLQYNYTARLIDNKWNVEEI